MYETEVNAARSVGMTPKISVILAAYNAADWIDECINSIRKQSFTDWELVLVDDGSSDSTNEIATGHAMEDSRIRILRQDNSGVSNARNFGIREARAPFLAFFDADDVMYEKSLELRYDKLQRSDADFVYGDHDYINAKSEFVRYGNNVDFTETALITFLQSPGCAIQTVLVRKTLVERAGMFRKGLTHGEDWDLWIRLANLGCKFAYVPESLNGYRIHGSNASLNRTAMLMGGLSMLALHKPLPQTKEFSAWRTGKYNVRRSYIWSAWGHKKSLPEFIFEIAKKGIMQPQLVWVLANECRLRLLRIRKNSK